MSIWAAGFPSLPYMIRRISGRLSQKRISRTLPALALTISVCLWNYKEKDFGLVDERFAEVKDDFIAVI